MIPEIFAQCQSLFPEWATLTPDDFDFDDPKGFSSFTMGIRAKVAATPKAVLYRRLAGKENAILDFETEKEIFLLLGAEEIAAHCYHYDETCRMERFYQGRTLTAADLFEPDVLRGIAGELYRFHQLTPPTLPDQGFFDLLLQRWVPLAKHVLEEKIDTFPPTNSAWPRNCARSTARPPSPR